MPIKKSDANEDASNMEVQTTKVEDEFVKEAPVIVESAKSGRSKCSACCEKIESGQDRVGVFGFKGGRLCYAWVHPLCFLKHAKVDYNASGRGKCKVTGKEFVKGQFRFAYRVGGSEKSFAYISMDGVKSIVPKVLEAAADFDISQISQIDELKPEDRNAFTAAAAVNRPSSDATLHGEKRALGSETHGTGEQKRKKPKGAR